MKELNLIEIAQVAGGAHGSSASFWEIVHCVAGAALGASLAASTLTAPVAIWGLIPLPLTMSGGFIGGSIGHILYNLEDITAGERNKYLEVV